MTLYTIIGLPIGGAFVGGATTGVLALKTNAKGVFALLSVPFGFVMGFALGVLLVGVLV